MKILYVHTGRIEETKANSLQTLQMCSAFAECGHEVTLAVNSYNLSGREASEKVRHELGVDQLPFEIIAYKGGSIFGKFKSLGCVPPINALTASVKHDVLFIREPVILPAIKIQSPRIIFEAHNYIAFPNGGPLDLLWRKLVVSRSKSDKLSLFIAISQALADWWIKKGVPADKVAALHDGVDPKLFSGVMTSGEARKRLSLPADRRIVTYAGSLYRDRCIPDILKLAKLHNDVLFVVVGGPDQAKAEYEAQAKQSGMTNIVFTGRVQHSKIPLYLAASDILLMLWSKDVPTINFCSPLKVFEYMAAGRIIVGHGFPTIKEVLTHGKNAYLADPDSFESLASNLAMALDKPNPTMADSAQKLVLEKYTWRKRCETIIERLEDNEH